MLRCWLAATTVAIVMTSVAVAQTSSSGGPNGPQQSGVAEPIMTSPGPAVAPRYLGSMAPTTVPGSGDQGVPLYIEHSDPRATIAVPGSGGQWPSMEDGNAPSMIVPGQPPKLMSTPE